MALALCKVYKTIGVDDPTLRAQIAQSLQSYERHVSRFFAPPIRITDRIAQLYPGAQYSQETLFRIGKAAAALHVREYGRAPERRLQQVGNDAKLVNVYTTETAHRTLDRAIYENAKFFE